MGAMPTSDQIRAALADVKDPELDLGILELGLVYDVSVEGDSGEHATVVMTLTSPMCPVGPLFKKSVEDRVLAVDGIKTAKVDITFSPPWDPATMASEDVKAALGIW
jgi:metal-sulfur cluster biosynthetic enzyme